VNSARLWMTITYPAVAAIEHGNQGAQVGRIAAPMGWAVKSEVIIQLVLDRILAIFAS
jgi:hypothetical protein